MLRKVMTDTATTTRPPGISSGKIGDPVAHLSGVKITPVMLSSATGMHGIRQAIGLDGSAIQVYEAYTTVHTHVDGGVSVYQVPDIVRGDRLTVGGVTYNVRWSETQPATFGLDATLLLYLTEDKRS
jgi:hypothetical protein